MALAVGDINSMWPLLCAAHGAHVHSRQFGSSMSAVDPFLNKTAAEVTKEDMWMLGGSEKQKNK